MRSTHRITLAVALAVSAVAGTAAASQTVHLGADAKEAPPISAKVLAAQKAKLAAADRSIDTALAARPPALPKVPEFAPLGEPRVPPLVVTRVVPVASPGSAGSGGGGDSANRSPASHPAPASSPAPAARTTRAPAAPAHVDRDDEDDDDRASGGDDEDHGEDRGGERGEESTDDHDDD